MVNTMEKAMVVIIHNGSGSSGHEGSSTKKGGERKVIFIRCVLY